MNDASLHPWELSRLEEPLSLLLGRAPSRQTFHSIPSGISHRDRRINPWLYAAALRAGLDVELVQVPGVDLEQAIRASAPILVVATTGMVAVRRVRGKTATVLTPSGREASVPLAAICESVRQCWAGVYGLGGIDSLIAHSPQAGNARIRRALLQTQLAARSVEVGWAVRPAVGSSWLKQLWSSGQLGILAKVASSLLAAEVMGLGAWYLLGRGALQGIVDRGWLAAWAVALLSAALLHCTCSFLEGSASIAVGALLKKRLLLGALRIDPALLQKEGPGSAMGRVLEAEALEELSLSGAFATVVALLDFAVSMMLLASVSIRAFLALLLALGVMLALTLTWFRRAGAWTTDRLTLTHALIEKVVGHRTRLAQGDPARVHVDEDIAVASYAKSSRSLDGVDSQTSALLPRGALLVGILALAPTLLGGGGSSPTLWVAVGSLLLARRALLRVGSGVGMLLEAAIALRRALPLLRAAANAEVPPSEVGLAAAGRTPELGETLIECSDVEFRFGTDLRPVLRGATLAVRAGDHVLVEGASGSGKSTLAALLAGLRAPQSGLVLYRGLDQHTLGESVWRRKVCLAPQYHANHVFQGTLAQNLLLGREWPATPDDLRDAEAVCLALGLGDLLDRMPSRLMQTVGTTGWRLSHGEQSRLYVARALLQASDLTILDESLAALDPETLDIVMKTIRLSTRSLAVVAHP
ncbi:MAG: ATP-binding cassette domain-containing protein [Deltaproteobacteria bacterium]|nr:ATP-binding cassette domain-containing protein [Deltaproteobacteria bacterium]